MTDQRDCGNCVGEIRVANMSDGVEYCHKVVPPLNLHTAKLESHRETPHGQEEKSIV